MHVYCEGILDLEDIDGIHVLLTSECMGELIYFRARPTDALRLRVEITSRRWRRPFSVVIIVSCERFGPKSSSVPGRGWQCAGENAYAAARIFVLFPCLPVRASAGLPWPSPYLRQKEIVPNSSGRYRWPANLWNSVATATVVLASCAFGCVKTPHYFRTIFPAYHDARRKENVCFARGGFVLSESTLFQRLQPRL